MKFCVTNLFTKDNKVVNGPLLISPKCFEDTRGFFLEEWNEVEWIELLEENEQKYHKFVQDNLSKSSKGVLRGLHFQIEPYPQSKLVRCISGEIFDVAVDLRKNSKTFGEWFGVTLSANNFKQLWIPAGFAHGFLTLSEFAEVLYKTDKYWNNKYERSIKWNDEQIAIKWPLEKLRTKKPIISTKDQKSISFYKAIKDKDILEVADALTDILYVTYGAGHAFGIDLDKCFEEVQNSNMSKLDENGKPIYNESGKVMKGPNYFKPDLSKFVN